MALWLSEARDQPFRNVIMSSFLKAIKAVRTA